MGVTKDMTERQMQSVKMSTLYELRLIFTNGEKKEYCCYPFFLTHNYHGCLSQN